MLTLAAFVKSMVLFTLIAVLGGGLFIYSGFYPIGADTPHHTFTYWVLETLRERSVARAAQAIKVPENLNSSDRLLAGGADYNDMCAECHLKPGKTQSDFTLGLYPSPPNLSVVSDEHGHTHSTSETSDESLKRQFWIIKHGIKASGMPAWGPTHSDERIWNMVAFLRRLPTLSSDQYQILTARADATESHDH